MIRRGRRSSLPLAALLTVAAVAASAQGHVLLHRCVGGGSWADLAVRLDVLRDTAACPDGTLGLGAVPSGTVVLMSVALPALAVWGLAGALGLSSWALVVRAMSVVAGLVVRWVALPRPVAAPVVPGRAPVLPAAPPARPPAAFLLVARPHRAPPLPA